MTYPYMYCLVTAQLPFSCSFESPDLCDMAQRTADQFDWARRSEGTPTTDTGPPTATDGDYYIYIEADPPQEEGHRA